MIKVPVMLNFSSFTAALETPGHDVDLETAYCGKLTQ